TGDPFASMILGQVHDANFAIPTNVTFYENYISPWVGDEIKVTPKLTLTLGLRFDYQTPRTESHDRYSSFDPTVPNPGAGVVPSIPLGYHLPAERHPASALYRAHGC